MEGYILIFRKLLEWEWYKNRNVKEMFLHCLLKANYKDNKWQGYEIKRGQFITSIRKLSNELSMTESQVRTSLKNLIKTCEIISTPINKRFTQITICNYDIYQNMHTENNKQDDKQITNKSQSNDKLMTITNKSNKDNKEINKRNNNIYTADFENFWNCYEKKGTKNNAFIEWKKLSSDDKTNAVAKIKPYFESISEQKYRKDAERYLKHRVFDNDSFFIAEEKMKTYDANTHKVFSDFGDD